MNKILQGDCLEVLKTLPDNSVDSCVTDPPYELGFMGKKWDNTGISNNLLMWKEVLRVLKPGGHLLSFGGTRTYHRMASAIEDAGFEVRDMIEWVYGSGFPKSLNIGKAVDKLQGNEREVVGEREVFGTARKVKGKQGIGASYTSAGAGVEFEEHTIIKDTKGNSEWEGWGTALKPAHEPICMARKPLSEKSVAENVLKYGTGGINIDESRVESNGEIMSRPFNDINEENVWNSDNSGYKKRGNPNCVSDQLGRFPANLIHDNSEEVRECFPETKSKGHFPNKVVSNNNIRFTNDYEQEEKWTNDSGNASRFFKSIIYQAKASKSERNRGCEGLEVKANFKMRESNSEEDGWGNKFDTQPSKNNHPTVKPIALMEYLIKMVTPKGGIVLDPFAGSGSTLVAAKQNNFQYIGIELDGEYIKIAEARLK